MSRRGPVDPRLLALSAPVRRWILLIALLTAAKTVTTVVIGVLIGTMTAGVIENPQDPPRHLLALLLATALRGALAWAETRYADRAAARVIIDLRRRTLRTLAHSDPRTVDQAAWRTRLSEGLDGLGPYLTGYLPALAATVIATPFMLGVVWFLDPGSMLIAVVTLPLIPVFMWLVGTLTAGRTEQRLRDLSAMSDQLLDLIAGLPTLRIFHRQRDMVAEVQRLSGRYASSTLGVLRIAFLSSFVLEFLATLSVALVAVGIGFRLLAGDLTLAVGLTVLIIIPEVYNPIRAVGARFHDAQDGLAATDEILSLLAAPSPPADSPGSAPVGGALTVVAEHVSVDGRDGPHPRDLSFTARPGRVTVLWGPNGSGKSTALLTVLGIATDGVHGRVEVHGEDGVLRGSSLWERCAFLPQRPVLDAATVGDTAALSLGQRQGVALASELQRSADLLLLDEPTAHLDADSARTMLSRLRAEADRGATVLLVSHDPLVREFADAVVEVA
ncbi:ABC transporter ATP-binding protein/permease [Corynebacterium pacaense]|uniref:ABC transporter ATP-binding protein/permease n=1 Tax=Corynebacterium pacaense TaxID=1816684 RepID=UPI0015C41C50|nr:ABC transporter transmembrane domain-containing protein [Corynebacterium pacaense]